MGEAAHCTLQTAGLLPWGMGYQGRELWAWMRLSWGCIREEAKVGQKTDCREASMVKQRDKGLKQVVCSLVWLCPVPEPQNMFCLLIKLHTLLCSLERGCLFYAKATGAWQLIEVSATGQSPCVFANEHQDKLASEQSESLGAMCWEWGTWRRQLPEGPNYGRFAPATVG